MKTCDPEGPVNVMISKLFPKTDCSAFDGFGRVMSGTLKKGQSVRVLVGTGKQCSPHHRMSLKKPAFMTRWIAHNALNIVAGNALGRLCSPHHSMSFDSRNEAS